MPSSASSPGAPERAPTTRWAGRWAWAPAALLVALIGTQISVLCAVLDDPTFATEPDYYRKAVDWDAHMAQARESRALGWSTRARVEPAALGSGREAALVLALSGARGEPIAGAHVHALAFFNARAARPLDLTLTETAAGEYRADFGARHAGVWELRVDAARDTDRYQTTLRLELGAAP